MKVWYVWPSYWNLVMSVSVQTFDGKFVILLLFLKKSLAYLRHWMLIQNQFATRSMSVYRKLI